MRVKQALGFLCVFFTGIFHASAADFVVTSSSHYATGGFWQVLQQVHASPGPHTITFAPSILPLTVALGNLTIDSDVTISGPGTDQVIFDFQIYNRGFVIPAGRTVSISGVTIENATAYGLPGVNGVFPNNPTSGQDGEGGGIRNSGALTVTDCVFRDCKAVGGKWRIGRLWEQPIWNGGRRGSGRRDLQQRLVPFSRPVSVRGQ